MPSLQKLIPIVLWLLNVACVANPLVTVEAYDEQYNNASQLSLRFRLYNNSGDSLYNVQVKYYLPYDMNRELYAQPWSLGSNEASLTIDTLKKKLQVCVNIPAIGPGYYPNEGGAVVGISYTDWQDVKKQTHFSYPDSRNFVKSEKISVSVDGALLSGYDFGFLLYMSDSSIVYPQGDEPVYFSWKTISNAKEYLLTIVKASDSSIVYQESFSRPSAAVKLETGSYFWSVVSMASGDGVNQTYYDFFDIDDVYFVEVRNDWPYRSLVELNVVPLPARKDTPMLHLGWGEKSLEKYWDRPRNTTLKYDAYGQPYFEDEENEGYAWLETDETCWAVSVTMLNHYYGGGITEDEILFHVNTPKKDSLLKAFPMFESAGGDGGKIEPALKWALNTTDIELQKNLSLKEIYDYLTDSTPIYVSKNVYENVDAIKSGKHIMLIDGMRVDTVTLDTMLRFVNLDNNGHYGWMSMNMFYRELHSKFTSFQIPHVNGPVRNRDTLLWDYSKNDWRDSDGDGLVDFDEVYRFKTDPNNEDSDGDGIWDKTEIMSYTLLEHFDENNGVTKETFADIDGDGLRAELDYDSDNGGKSDGEEDLNHNGFKDEGEKSPYSSFDDLGGYDVSNLDYFTFYALNQLWINDGVKCFDGMDSTANLCNVASAGTVENYTVTIGARAQVGNVYSRGDFFLRSHSSIDTLYLIGKVDDVVKKNNEHADVISVHVQDGFQRNKKLIIPDTLWKSKWPISFMLDTFDSSFKTLQVRNGEVRYLNDGDRFGYICVERGGTLVLNPGEYWINEIWLLSGSDLIIAKPDEKIEMHVNGKFGWRARLSPSDYAKIAKGFKLILHGNETFYVDDVFAGTIVAPNAKVVVGQSVKKFYGSVVAKDIEVHQYSYVYHVPYEESYSTQYAKAGE
ncbi:MAG: hypothetical protein MJY99_04340 [Fibrobacter sp.]|nr:hypothetical protein [Fibrobacter sp.]